ncbi:OsmC family protein [Cupriavidus respiraculi]|uniref:Uncharacterized protein n=2 Tax=Cupriavidus respiraculi TaxID=195930 RepID=A0ABN7Y211_9BURK|nr:hypothetical protein LMG21510_00347 [Cupriavidus respiraculi]
MIRQRVVGGAGGGTNPEQLFAAGYAASFPGMLSLLAPRARVAFADATVAATVVFGRDPRDGGYALVADLRVHLSGVERAVAEALVRDAERLCQKMSETTRNVAPVTTNLGNAGTCAGGSKDPRRFSSYFR